MAIIESMKVSVADAKNKLPELIKAVEDGETVTICRRGVSAVDTRHALDDLDLRVLPYTANHAFSLFDLPLLHADPFDRQIIAQALSEEIPVMTCDEKFSLYKGLKVLW